MDDDCPHSKLWPEPGLLREDPLVPAKFEPADSPVEPREMPNSLDAEKGLLSSMLLSPQDVIPDCIENIDGSVFYLPAHTTIHDILVSFYSGGTPIDFITLTQVLRDRGLLESVGGPAYVTHLFGFTPTAANAAYYREIVEEKAILRRLIKAGTEIVQRAYGDREEVAPLLDASEASILAIAEKRARAAIIPLKDRIHATLDQLEQVCANRGQLTGLATGFAGIDQMTNGLQRSEMIVIAARPSVGKTALAMNIAEFVAVNGRRPVLVFSLEMSGDQLLQRLLCSSARVNLQKLRNGFLAERDFQNLTAAAGRLGDAEILIDDSAGLSILELRAKARRLQKRHQIALVVIDYLQLLKSTSRRASENRQIEISEISGGIKALAKELNVPVLVLAQLNRQPDARVGGRPRLSDLRESGSIEQTADVVALLMRSEMSADDEETRLEKAGEAELIIAKQRNGPTGEIPLTFLKEFTRFEDRAVLPAPPPKSKSGRRD
jgi:replicative DNA helicase